MGLWHAIDRAVAKPNDNGKLKTVCTINLKEKKQEWTSLHSYQLLQLYRIYVIYVEIEFIVFLIGSGKHFEEIGGGGG